MARQAGTSGSVLDRWPARVAALVVAAAALAALLHIHRRELFPSGGTEAASSAAPDPFQACMAQRGGDIDRLLQEGTIQKPQADLFRSRAEALCRAEANKALGQPSSGGAPGPGPAAGGLPPGLQPAPVPARRF
jgi:hypothetical protein